MLGHMRPDTWALSRKNDGLLNQRWFWSCSSWHQQHTNNLRRTFRLDDPTPTESCTWLPMDAWVWHEKVVLFSGIWIVQDGTGAQQSKFDVVYLSMPCFVETTAGRTDLVLMDTCPEEQAIPSWYAKPLGKKASPLWWRLNKDLHWAPRFISMLATSTKQESWLSLGISEELRASIPMFDRAWSAMASPSNERLATPDELPVPSWAQDNDEID